MPSSETCDSPPAHDAGAATCDSFRDRKSTRLNSSHGYISYAVFCLKKKKNLLNYDSTRAIWSERTRSYVERDETMRLSWCHHNTCMVKEKYLSWLHVY